MKKIFKKNDCKRKDQKENSHLPTPEKNAHQEKESRDKKCCGKYILKSNQSHIVFH